MNTFNEDAYMQRQDNAYFAKQDQADARQDRIDEVTDGIVAVKFAELATIKLHERSGGYVSKRSPLADIIGEIDETEIADIGKLLVKGLFLAAGLMLGDLVDKQILKEATYEAENQVDEEGGEYD